MNFRVKTLEWGDWIDRPPYLSWRDAKEMRVASTAVGTYKLLYRPLISKKEMRYDRLLDRGKWFVETAVHTVIGPFNHDVEAAKAAQKFHEEYVTEAVAKECELT